MTLSRTQQRWCEKCKTRKARDLIHPSEYFLCELCAKYNDDCVRDRVVPEWDKFVRDSLSEEGAVGKQQAPDNTGVNGDGAAGQDKFAGPLYVNLPPLAG